MRHKARAPRNYAEGEIFHYRGNPLALEIMPAAEPPDANERVGVSEGGHLVVRAIDAENAKKFILYWYTAKTEDMARALVPEWSKKLRVRPRVVHVRYAKTRWGSCSSAGRIFLNTRLAMLSDDVAEYVVVHELCHLKQMNHGKEFWDEVKKAIPSALALRRSLRAQEYDAVL